jgi:hypothetical protein
LISRGAGDFRRLRRDHHLDVVDLLAVGESNSVSVMSRSPTSTAFSSHPDGAISRNTPDVKAPSRTSNRHVRL